jgi:hypothetical protein
MPRERVHVAALDREAISVVAQATPDLGAGLSGYRNPMLNHGTAATTIRPARIASRYGQIRRIAASGDTRPIAQAA